MEEGLRALGCLWHPWGIAWVPGARLGGDKGVKAAS